MSPVSGFVADDFFIMTDEERNDFIKKLKSFLKNDKTTKNKNLIKVKKEGHTAFLETIYPYYKEDTIKIGLFYKNGTLFFVSSVDKKGITLEFEDKELLKKGGKISIAKNLTKKTEHFFTKEEYFFFKKLAEDIKDFFLPNSLRFINKL